jgi:hypothetical protein
VKSQAQIFRPRKRLIRRQWLLAGSIRTCQRTLPASQGITTKLEMTDFPNLGGKPAFKMVLLSNLGWIPPIRLLLSQWWPIILIIAGILVLIQHSPRSKQ